MITHRSYTVEPWAVRETDLSLDVLAQSESVFAPSNGHVGRRGNLDEGEPHGLPGSYLNGMHELHPLPYAEAGYGYPESGRATAVSSPTNELWTCVGESLSGPASGSHRPAPGQPPHRSPDAR